MTIEQDEVEELKMYFDYCPSCMGELDTGFECLKCGRDWRPWAMSQESNND